MIILVACIISLCDRVWAQDPGADPLTLCYQSVKRPGVQSFMTAECQKAADLYQDKIVAEPGSSENYLLLGRCLGFMGQFEMAAQYVDKAITLAPDDWTPHMDKAMNYVALKRYSQARPEFQRSLELLKSGGGKDSDIQMVEELMKKYENK
ncbi:MAG: hypothetical protein HGA80_09725 [Candidatus Omnitrophica bacterium]|nr:hypothetical protein [Candidatus Omnitrophota bacterium]